MKSSGLSVAALVVSAVLSQGCPKKDDSGSTSGDNGSTTTTTGTGAAAGPSSDVHVRVAYGSEKKTWMELEAKAFLATNPKTASGHPIKIDLDAMGSGEAMQAIVGGTEKATVYSPASSAYINLINDAYKTKSGKTKSLAPAGDVLLTSPVVIAAWKPMASALGWPSKPIGWADLAKFGADPKGWSKFGFPEWGQLKLGHTHPEYSNSGLLAILAEAYAGAGKTRGLTMADLDAAPTKKLLESVEDTMVHYGKSTGFFADKMQERGPSYISAAVMYENLVIESYGKPDSNPPLVAIYPKEGTFWSDHPYSILDGDWVSADEKDGAQAFLNFLKAKPAQQKALELGFRPGDATIAIGAPIDDAHGVNPKEPQTLLEVPDAATLNKLIAVWRSLKKGSDVVLAFDKSGSMNGKPMNEARKGAHAFLDSLSDVDQASLLFFDQEVYPPVGPMKMDTGRKTLQDRVDATVAGGGTALYDAIATAYDQLKARDPKVRRIRAVLVMTDGKDESSSKYTLDDLKAKLPSKGEGDIRVFTIAYGDQANDSVLSQIAEAAGGSSAKGSVDNIGQIYADMAAFF